MYSEKSIENIDVYAILSINVLSLINFNFSLTQLNTTIHSIKNKRTKVVFNK